MLKWTIQISTLFLMTILTIFRLNFSKSLVEDDRAKAQYDLSSGYMIVHVPKLIKGEWFDDLDLLTKLLLPGRKSSEQRTGKSLIEVLNSSQDLTGTERLTEEGKHCIYFEMWYEYPLPFPNGSSFLDIEQLDWNFPQKLPDEFELGLGARYGFNHQYSGLFTNLQTDILEIIDLIDPETSTEVSRREARIMDEDVSFDEEYYM